MICDELFNYLLLFCLIHTVTIMYSEVVPLSEWKLFTAAISKPNASKPSVVLQTKKLGLFQEHFIPSQAAITACEQDLHDFSPAAC